MSGWIRLERASWKHDFFPKEAMSQREAWHWMIARAAWEDTTHRINGVEYPVPRGSFFITFIELQSAFYWSSEKRVRTFLNRLEFAEMIGRKKGGKGEGKKTHLTICNYDKYQDVGRKKGEIKTEKRRTKETNKQVNNNHAGAISSIEELVDFWAERINGDAYVSAASISSTLSRALLASGKVTPEKLKERGIAA